MSTLSWTPHPVLKIPTREQCLVLGSEKTIALWQQREEKIALEKTDPFHHGFRPAVWDLALQQIDELRAASPNRVIELMISGGNRGSKTEFAAWLAMSIMVRKPAARTWCMQMTLPSSRENQQPLLWKYLPAEWKPSDTGKLRKGVTANVTYTEKGGFTEETFVLPNSSKCRFKAYSEDVRNVEGAELDVAWCDELVTPDWLEAVRFRLLTRAGLLILTFTPVEGYTQTVKEYVDGATTLRELPAELLVLARPQSDRRWQQMPDGRILELVPRLQQPVRRNARIVYFHTADNPYGNYEAMKAECLEKGDRERTLMRAYGVATKSVTSRFPKFRDHIHVLLDEQVAQIAGTNYLLVDPCNGRNFFMCWVRVNARGRKIIYREWPSPNRYIEGVGLPGPWAVPSGRRHDGDQGDAQKSFGFGLERYRREILTLEGWRATGKKVEGFDGEAIDEFEPGVSMEPIERRYMDARFGAAPILRRGDPITLIESMAELGLSPAEAMDFEPMAAQKTVDDGIDLVNDALDYDPSRPIGHDNEPRLFVAASCLNIIYALKEWTGADGPNGACKDPVDVVRGAVTTEGIDYLAPGAPFQLSPRGYGRNGHSPQQRSARIRTNSR